MGAADNLCEWHMEGEGDAEAATEDVDEEECIVRLMEMSSWL